MNANFALTMIAALLQATFLQAQSTHHLDVAAPLLFEDKIYAPYWDRDLLFLRSVDAYTVKPQLTVLDGSGRVQNQIRVQIPDATDVRVMDAAGLNKNGDLVLSVVARDSGAHLAALLCFYDKNAALLRTLRTNPFSANLLRVAADGSIWGFGVATDRGVASAETIWRFSPDGQVLGKYMKRTEFNVRPGEHPALTGNAGKPFLVTGGNYVGVYAPAANEWVEFSADGQMVGKWIVPLPDLGPVTKIARLAMTPGEEVLAWLTGLNQQGGLFRLDRGHLAWVRISERNFPKSYAGLVGVQGDQLIVGGTGGSGKSLFWLPLSTVLSPDVASVRTSNR